LDETADARSTESGYGARAARSGTSVPRSQHRVARARSRLFARAAMSKPRRPSGSFQCRTTWCSSPI
jgi:hypothetical protein